MDSPFEISDFGGFFLKSKHTPVTRTFFIPSNNFYFILEYFLGNLDFKFELVV